MDKFTNKDDVDENTQDSDNEDNDGDNVSQQNTTLTIY